MRKNKKKALIKGFWCGLSLSLLLLIGVSLLGYDGTCGVSLMGGGGHACTFFEFLTSSEDFMFIVLAFLSGLWWLTPIIVGTTMLTMYGLTNHNHN